MQSPSETSGSGIWLSASVFQSLELESACLLEAMHDLAIFMIDPEGRVASWNKGGEQLLGYQRHEAVGRHFASFYSDRDRARGAPDAALREAAATGRHESDAWRPRRNGPAFHANVVITPLADEGRLKGYVNVLRDATERQRVLAALRESVESSQQLLDRLEDQALFLLDPAGLVLSWNAGAARIEGYRADEIVGQSVSRFYAAEDVRRGTPGHVLERAASEGRSEDTGTRLRKNGTTFRAHVVTTALRRADGTLRGFAVLAREVPEDPGAPRRPPGVVT